VDPERLPDAVVVYCDSTVVLPLLTHYVLAAGERRAPKRLYDRLPRFLELLVEGFSHRREERMSEGTFSEDDPALRS
jgi:hypothetical protein